MLKKYSWASGNTFDGRFLMQHDMVDSELRFAKQLLQVNCSQNVTDIFCLRTFSLIPKVKSSQNLHPMQIFAAEVTPAFDFPGEKMLQTLTRTGGQ